MKTKFMCIALLLLSFLFIGTVSYIAADTATCDLGPTNVNTNMNETTPAVADGDTVGATDLGCNHRDLAVPTGDDHYFYFQISDGFSYQGNHPSCTVTFSYYDIAGAVVLRLQYDAISSAYMTHPTIITTGGTSTWKTASFVITDAYFGNRENNGSDLRVNVSGTSQTHLDSISVTYTSTPSPGCSLTPTSVADGQFTTTSVGGSTVWQNINGSLYMYFDVPSTFSFTPGVPVYVEVCYYDSGKGTVGLQYDARSNAYLPSEVHTRSTRVGTNVFVYSYQKLADPNLANRENNLTDLRVCLTGSDGTPLSVRSLTINTSVFSNSEFQLAITKPWEAAYSGTSQETIPNNTILNRVMCGYQGWFRCPNDLSDGGNWIHWVQTPSTTISAANFGIDMWPDLAGFAASEKYKADAVLTQSGQQAYLFSSINEATVMRHFAWMTQYSIDGVFLQRFLTPTEYGPSVTPSNEWPFVFVREGAHHEGRLWAIEYDVANLSNSNVYNALATDWAYLVNNAHIKTDSRYAHENGKLIVAIYGLALTSSGITAATAGSVVDFFKNDGEYVYGGVPGNWNQSGWSSAWSAHFDKYNAIQPWMPSTSQWQPDINRCNAKGQQYVGHAWPGFSWAHLKNLNPNDSSYKDRQGGTFFTTKSNGLKGKGCNRMFVGMFDECDEATAIFPMTDDHPYPRSATRGRFIDNQGQPASHWLSLAGAIW